MSGTKITSAASLLEASSFLVARGFCGFVWLDDDLVVRDRVGPLVEFVHLSVPVGTALLPLYGCENDIRGLRTAPHAGFELANVRIIDARLESPRINIFVYWLEASSRYVVIVIRASAQSEVEAELENQSRRRALAEAKTIEQAKALERANAELTRANRDLDEFANIISHDLKSPMRALRYLSEDIEEALARADREAAAAHLADLRQHARRMSRMLTDLLSYARIGPNSEEARSTTDTRLLVDAIVASLPRPPEFRIEIAGDWPVLRTVEAALDLVLRNLLDNAIKHHDRTNGTVRLMATPRSTGLEIAIVDDGPGIDPRYHETVFQPFRQLQPNEGRGTRSGIGLSLVSKTCESNRAELRLESAPTERRGTTFRLNWPGDSPD